MRRNDLLPPFAAVVALGLAAVTALALPAAAAPGLRDTLVDVNEDGASVLDVLRRLEAAHGINYVVNHRTLAEAGTVTVHLRQVPLDAALDAICTASALRVDFRGGGIVVITPLAGPQAPPSIPHVPDGIIPEGGNRLPGPVPPPLSQAVGNLVGVDVANDLLQLRIDDVVRDFYLPADDPQDPALQARRLRQACANLRPGTRVALLFRRTRDRNVVDALIGGVPGRQGGPQTPPPDAPPPAPRGGVTTQDDDRPRTAPEGAGAGPGVPEGSMAGVFVGREGEVVSVRRADGAVVPLRLPDGPSERRTRIVAAIDAMRAGDRILLTFDLIGDQRVITNTITQVR